MLLVGYLQLIVKLVFHTKFLSKPLNLGKQNQNCYMQISKVRAAWAARANRVEILYNDHRAGILCRQFIRG